MDPPSSQNIGSQATAHVLPRLVSTYKRDGRAFERFADVEGQILSMVATDPATWQIGKLKSETLVYLARWLWPKGDDRTLGNVIDCLGRRIATIARDVFGGLEKPVAQELADEIAQDVNVQIFATTPTRQSEFLEVSFRTAVKRRALNALEKHVTHTQTEVFASTFEKDSGNEDNDGFMESFPDGEATPVEKAITKEEVRNALGSITDERHKEAVILHFLEEWPISGKKGGHQTLCSHFGMSARQIQNWLNRAMDEMRAALGSDI